MNLDESAPPELTRPGQRQARHDAGEHLLPVYPVWAKLAGQELLHRWDQRRPAGADHHIDIVAFQPGGLDRPVDLLPNRPQVRKDYTLKSGAGNRLLDVDQVKCNCPDYGCKSIAGGNACWTFVRKIPACWFARCLNAKFNCADFQTAPGRTAALQICRM
jgi:hypothetical protein